MPFFYGLNKRFDLLILQEIPFIYCFRKIKSFFLGKFVLKYLVQKYCSMFLDFFIFYRVLSENESIFFHFGGKNKGFF